jgi:hypothetical protein
LIQKTSAKNTRKQDECLKRTLENEEEWEEWIISRKRVRTKMRSKSSSVVRQKCASSISSRCMGSNRAIRIGAKADRIEKEKKKMTGTNTSMSIMIRCTKLMLCGLPFVFSCGSQQ